MLLLCALLRAQRGQTGEVHPPVQSGSVQAQRPRNRSKSAQGQQSLRSLLWHREIVPSHRSEDAIQRPGRREGVGLKEIEGVG